MNNLVSLLDAVDSAGYRVSGIEVAVIEPQLHVSPQGIYPKLSAPPAVHALRIMPRGAAIHREYRVALLQGLAPDLLVERIEDGIRASDEDTHKLSETLVRRMRSWDTQQGSRP